MNLINLLEKKKRRKQGREKKCSGRMEILWLLFLLVNFWICDAFITIMKPCVHTHIDQCSVTQEKCLEKKWPPASVDMKYWIPLEISHNCRKYLHIFFRFAKINIQWILFMLQTEMYSPINFCICWPFKPNDNIKYSKLWSRPTCIRVHIRNTFHQFPPYMRCIVQ